MVPKIIHQIAGPNPSGLVIKCLDSWKILEGENFALIVWNDDLIEKFIFDKYPFALEAFNTARNHGEAADIARYLIIYEYGGYYVDWDIELTKPNLFLDLHLKFTSGYLLIDPQNGSIASEHFSASIGESYLLNLARDIVATFNRGERELMQTPYYSGPYRMKVSLKINGGSGQNQVPIKEIFECDYWEIRKYVKQEPTRAMIHYWLNSWVKKY